MSHLHETVKLGDENVASVILGQSPPSLAYNEAGDGLPFFQGKADFGLVHPVPRIWCNAGQKFSAADDILMSVRAPVGDVNMATGNCVIGRGVAAIRAGHRADPWYLYFALIHAKPELQSRSTGSTFASINKSTLHDVTIPFPEKSEQVRIATFLRSLVERLHEESSLLALTRDLKRAVMQAIFSQGLRGESQKDTEIGTVPESWDVVPLGSLGRVGNGSTPKKSVREYWEGGTYPWLTSAKVYDREIVAAERFVTEAALRECHLPLIEPGSVLIAITGQGRTLGHCAVLGMQATINQHIAYVATDTARANPSFIRGYLETRYEYLRQVGSGGGSTKGALTCAFLRDLLIPFPLLEDQREIANILDAVDRTIDLHSHKRSVIEQLFKVILHKLMTGEIRADDLDLSALETRRPEELVA